VAAPYTSLMHSTLTCPVKWLPPLPAWCTQY